MSLKLHNHIAPGLSKLEWEMVKHIPEGGNWENIPVHIPSKRLEQIRNSGGRTTYYGRLEMDKPSYTITTYFHRLGNGCNLHPRQDRIISIREGARLQSFSDKYIFYGNKSSQYKQIGNAVPPLLARAIAHYIKPHVSNRCFIDLFAGAGGMSEGFLMENFRLIAANEIEPSFFETYKRNHVKYDFGNNLILGDICSSDIQEQLIQVSKTEKIGVLVGGPPCQGFSHAGWRDPNDKRNLLFREFVKVLNKIRPEVFVMENVPGLLTMRRGEAIKEILLAFKEIGYHLLNPIKLSAECFGVPQRRKRVFLIGSLTKIDFGKLDTLFSNDEKQKPIPITVAEAIGGLPYLESGTGQAEIYCDYRATSEYEKLMMGETDFPSFYNAVKNRIKSNLSHLNMKLF